jgi:hypothetical protein
MSPEQLNEALEHIAHIKAAMVEISADLKAIIAQLSATEQREQLRRKRVPKQF